MNIRSSEAEQETLFFNKNKKSLSWLPKEDNRARKNFKSALPGMRLRMTGNNIGGMAVLLIPTTLDLLRSLRCMISSIEMLIRIF
jgi:hypothetical protein